MGLFDLFGKKQVDAEDVDYISNAEAFEKKGDFVGAISEYEKLIQVIYADKPEARYRHVYKKIINCYVQLGDYEKVFEKWKLQYDPFDYGAKEMYELIKILEAVQRLDLVMKVYDIAGKKLIRNKIEFLIKQKKIPEANALLNELMINVPDSDPAATSIWMLKAKLSMSLTKWEEANRYLSKILDRNQKDIEARKLKDFCLKQVRGA